MFEKSFDIITVGGGLAGSSLAYAMAKEGAEVLVSETETQFRDRVRGEGMSTWGVKDAIGLGILDTIMSSSGHPLIYGDSSPSSKLVFAEQNPDRLHYLSFCHPEMQEGLIQAAQDAGAVVCRGARVTGVSPGISPSVSAIVDGAEVEVKARLVIGADGRTSRVRGWGGFQSRRDPDNVLTVGVLLDGSSAPEDTFFTRRCSSQGLFTLVVPLGKGRVRVYLAHSQAAPHRLSGEKDIGLFIKESVKVGAPPEYFKDVTVAGPLATFSGACSWVEHPYKNGVALVGDAACASDPSHGQGLSLTIRDARLLRDCLVGNDNWVDACHTYAEEHDRYAKTLHRYQNWLTEVLMEVGPEADALRERVLPLWRQDPTRRPSLAIAGPDFVLDESARRRFFGED